MARVVEQTVYKYEELSDEAKERARNWYREGSLDYEWYDSVFYDFKEIGKILGLSVDNIYFSGFYTQGSGANFTGSYSYRKNSVKELKAYAPMDSDLHDIAERLQAVQKRNFYQLAATITGVGRYFSISVDTERYDGRDVDWDSGDEVKEIMEALCSWVYSALQREYEFLMADEQIEESIIANDYEFNEDGSIY